MSLAFLLPDPLIVAALVFEDPDFEVARVSGVLVHFQIHVLVLLCEFSLDSAHIACDPTSCAALLDLHVILSQGHGDQEKQRDS